MRKPLLAGNWKMNLLYSKVPAYLQTLADEIASKTAGKRDKVDVLLAVPAPFLAIAREFGEKNGFLIAAQTIHEKADGAYTGEISIPMLKDLGIRWTLIGHSERRQYFNESDQSVALKTKACLDQGLNAIVCVGETRAEREAGQTEEVLKRQLEAVLQQTGQASDFVLAYEPVWAIGTGLTATDEQAQAAHAFIRSILRQSLGAAGDAIRLLYGGSVKSSNIKGLMQQADVDGALVGGASLDPIEFARIVDGPQDF